MSNFLYFKVRGVTFEGRQEIIKTMTGDEPVRIVAEPDNPFDNNALAIFVAKEGEVCQIGYVPKENAATLAPYLEGEPLTGHIVAITGGFVKADNSIASYGVEVVFDLPDETNPADFSAGWEP
jgi:hypothetical protein